MRRTPDRQGRTSCRSPHARILAGILGPAAACLALLGCASRLEGAPADPRLSFYQVAKLLAADGVAGDLFGRSVAIDSDRLVVGADNHTHPGYPRGAVYVFERDEAGAWNAVAELFADNGDELDTLGRAVALSGDRVVAGNPNSGALGVFSGSAYVFERDDSGLWRQVAELFGDDTAEDDTFGNSVAISGDRLVVGADGDDDLGDDSGSAYVFERDDSGLWSQVAKLHDAEGAQGDNFGDAVAMCGNRLVVGSPFSDGPDGTADGSALVFERDETGAWSRVARIRADGDAHFGRSVAISGDRVAVAARPASDSAYVFERDETGAWTQVAQLRAHEDAHFGESIGISGDRVVVGAESDDDLGSGSGAAYVFQRNEGGAWNQVAKLLARDTVGGVSFAVAVGISGGRVVGASPWDDDLGQGSGSAYVFEETLVEPSLAVSGPCPGELTFAASGFTPGGRVELWGAFGEGADPFPTGPCRGIATSLGGPVPLGIPGWADDAGTISGTRTATEEGCAALFQALDLTSCAVSNVIQAP